MPRSDQTSAIAMQISDAALATAGVQSAHGQLELLRRGRTKPDGDRLDVVIALRKLREFNDGVGVDIGANEGDEGGGDED